VVDDVGVQEMIILIQSLGLTVVSELVTRLVVEHHHRPLNPGELGSQAMCRWRRSASGPAGAACPGPFAPQQPKGASRLEFLPVFTSSG
jgi:hypothetical protein